jgi:hypothetical protein
VDWCKIQQLTWYLPESDGQRFQDTGAHGILNGVTGRSRISRTIQAYVDLKFGWRYVRKLIDYGLGLPPIIDPQDAPLHRAYYFLKYGQPDPAIETALHLGAYPELESTRALIDSMFLLCPQDKDRQAHLKQLARDTGTTLQALNAYEKLFFNVRDRLHDTKFIEQVVYPNTRLEELSDGYGTNTPYSLLLMRTAYNHGPEALRYLTGGQTQFSSAGNTQEVADKLEMALMNQALIMASIGYANQRNVPALNNGRQLIQAAKMGGQEATLDPILVGLGTAIKQDMGNVQAARRSRIADSFEEPA